ncbi:MAG: hypothetical protein MJY77_01255 [Bacteroidaceae bacterium]|nr:hypothetical protein [Bacteroidaceae bacterium]
MKIDREYTIPGSGGELASALMRMYGQKGLDVGRSDVIAWGYAGELYIAVCLNDYPVQQMREEQYAVREAHGVIDLDCRDYDLLYSLLAGSSDAVGVCIHIPDVSGALHDTWVERQLIYDMFDFCRDGIG